MVDTATQITEVYTWNDDGTLASYPYGGNTITAAYNEESLLVSLSVNGSTAYQYGYACMAMPGTMPGDGSRI